jgi:hypothetical protein
MTVSKIASAFPMDISVSQTEGSDKIQEDWDIGNHTGLLGV